MDKYFKIICDRFDEESIESSFKSEFAAHKRHKWLQLTGILNWQFWQFTFAEMFLF